MKLNSIITTVLCISLLGATKELQSVAQKTVLLTGAAGFIGSTFLRYMFDKYEDYNFLVLDSLTYAGNLNNIPDYIRSSERFEFIYGSVTNQALVDNVMSKSQLVVHFAAESHVTNSIYEDNVFFDTDVMGTRVLMRALVKYSDAIERFIHISTSEVCGTAEYIPMDEKHPIMPRSPYAAAKAGADRLVFSYWCTYDIPVVLIRPFNNYGPNQHLEKVIPRFITAALKGDTLKVHGSGEQKRDWLHTSDTCRAIDLALHINNFDTIKNQVIHIGSGKGISINEIAQTITKVMGLPNDRIEHVDDRPGQVDCHISSTAKAKELLGWEASMSFEFGIKQTIDWYSANKDWWKDTTLMAEYLLKDAFKTKTI